jgi:hypothetical protein
LSENGKFNFHSIKKILGDYLENSWEKRQLHD